MAREHKRELDVSDRGTLTALTMLGIVFWPVTLGILVGALVWEGMKRIARK